MATATPTTQQRVISVGGVRFGNDLPLAFIAGPCVIESPEHAVKTAKHLSQLAKRLRLPYVFKSSYDKANRSSIKSFRGPGLNKGLQVLAEVKKKFGVPVLSDVHSTEEMLKAASILDIIQIPAFLCRQTDLLVAAAKT